MARTQHRLLWAWGIVAGLVYFAVSRLFLSSNAYSECHNYACFLFLPFQFPSAAVLLFVNLVGFDVYTLGLFAHLIDVGAFTVIGVLLVLLMQRYRWI